jgi:hypothetical protein
MLYGNIWRSYNAGKQLFPEEAMSTIDDKINAIMAEAKRKADQLRAKEEAIHARKLESIMKKDRASDTRRKILLGALLAGMMEEDENTKTRVMARLDKFLEKPADRDLFGLPAKQKPAKSGEKNDSFD